MERFDRNELKAKKCIVKKIRTSSSNCRLRSLPRLTSHRTLQNVTSNKRLKSLTRQAQKVDKFCLSLNQNAHNSTLDEGMSRLNSLALQNQDKHRSWLNLHSKIIELSQNSSSKENLSSFHQINLDTLMSKLSSHYSLPSKPVLRQLNKNVL